MRDMKEKQLTQKNEAAYPPLKDVGEDYEGEADADGDAGGVVEDHVAAEGRRVHEQEEADHSHADLQQKILLGKEKSFQLEKA